jgi:hypothetical protein
MHSVFVLSVEGNPLTPTTPARARKLLNAGVAQKVWSKFGTFGIQLLTPTRTESPLTTLGYDGGTKFEGFAVVCGHENVLAVKLDLPDKKKSVRKLKARNHLRRSRRSRKRRRPARFFNRRRKTGWLAPSQGVLVQARLKILSALFTIYSIQRVGFEDVRFHHARHRWGANFSTVEIGKTRLKNWISEKAEIILYQGWQTKQFRQEYGYHKSADKQADTFSAHCSDALALACAVGLGQPVRAGRFVIVDDTYRPVRRRLHDVQPAKGGVRAVYSTGTVFGLRKGLLIGARNGKVGRLCGRQPKGILYYDEEGRRQTTTLLRWISTHFVIREGGKRQFPLG